MSPVYCIPRKVEAFEEGSQAQDVTVSEGSGLVYSPVDGEFIDVLLWERYPSYDIIFGVPNKSSPRHEKEVGYYTLRRVGQTEHIGFYFDIKESQAMVEGFGKILEVSKTHSPHIWSKHSQM